MKVISKNQVSIAEAGSYVENLEENILLKDYFKKFTKLSKEKADKLKEEIKSLNNLKINEEKVIKIVDFLPKEAEEVHKIFTDVSLSEDETNKIIEIVKNY
jgi:DNA-directed RNA polymerase subunit F